MTKQLTAQALDPLGGITARVLVVVAICIALVEAVAMSAVTASQVSYPLLEALALLAIAASGAYYVRATSPFRPAFSMRSHAIVCLLALAAVVFNSVAQWGSNVVVRDDWGPLAMATITLTLGTYRPAREIMICSTVVAVAIGALAFLQADTFRTDVPGLVYAIVPASPIFAAGVAAATFSRSLVGSLVDWRTSPQPSAASAPHDSSDAAGSPARASHLVHLDEQVVPFLTAVSLSPTLSEADGARARLLGRELRTLMVIDAERSWLERIVRRVSDPHRVAEQMSESERGFLRAVVSHVRNSDVFVAESLRVSLGQADARRSIALEIECAPSRNPRVSLAPYVAVAHGVFAAVDWQISGTALSIVLAAESPARLEEA